MKRRVYILSTGRTATNFLANYFDTHPDAIGRHEPGLSRLLRLASNMRLAGVIRKRSARIIFRLFNSSNRSFEPVYVESNPFILGFTDIISELHPSSKVVHIVRDPRTYVTSIINHDNTVGFKYFINKHLPFWLWRNSKSVDSTTSGELFTRYAEYWSVANKFIAEHAKESDYCLFRFEDVFKPPYSDLGKLERFVGLDMSEASGEVTIEKPLNKSDQSVQSDWSDWDDEEVLILDKMCGELMKQYGYGEEQEWLNRVGRAVSNHSS